jgi:phosphoadenosine phosphosulfate reductase
VGREGKDAMYKSIELRKACCGIRKMEPLERALAGQRAWITGLRRSSPSRADVPLIDTSRSKTGRVKLNPLANWTWGDVWHYIAPTAWTTTRCTTSFSPASAARPAPAPSAWAKTSAPGAGGGKRIWKVARQGMRPARENKNLQEKVAA